MAVGPDGEVYVVWEDFADGEILGAKSLDDGQTFSSPFVVGPIQDNLASGPPGYYAGGNRRSPIYNPCSYSVVPAFPSIAVDRSSSPYRGKVYVTWAEHAAGTVSSRMGLAGEQEPNTYYDTASPIAFGDDFYGLLAGELAGGDRDILYFDGPQGTTIWLQAVLTDVEGGFSPECLRLTLVSGADTTVLLADINLREDYYGPTMPPMIFTLPETGRYYLEFCCSGEPDYYYRLNLRTLTPAAESASRDHRDIVLVSSSDGGSTWSPKLRVNDDPPWYDNSFPEVAVDGGGRVHMAWYDRRDSPTASGGNAYWAFSRDGGASFDPSSRVSSQTSSWWRVLSLESSWGDHLGLTAEGERAYVLWTQEGASDLDIHAATISEVPTPVRVTGFRARPGPDSVILEWVAPEDGGLAGFRVHRSESGPESAYKIVGSVSLDPGGDYAFTDGDVRAGREYHYKLEAALRSGETEWFGPVHTWLPNPGVWIQAAPNPFRQEVSLELNLGEPAVTDVRVLDTLGRLVRRLGPLPAGDHALTWDGRDGSGRQVPAGMYFIIAEHQGGTEEVKIVRFK